MLISPRSVSSKPAFPTGLQAEGLVAVGGAGVSVGDGVGEAPGVVDWLAVGLGPKGIVAVAVAV